MKILLTTACWGEDYIATLVDYSAASLLAPGNLPHVQETDVVTWQIIAPEVDIERFQHSSVFPELKRLCRIDAVSFESLGYDPDQVPRGITDKKYNFLSQLQNHAILSSAKHDVIVFNYADFVWSDGSLWNCLNSMRSGKIDAVMSFCLPVDETAGKRALEQFRQDEASRRLVVAPRACSGLVLDNLHRETRLRFWNSEKFTKSPSYVIWPVGNEGIVLRACHVTVLALRVKISDPDFMQGICGNSLDGHFSAVVAQKWPYLLVNESDRIMVFSLYDTTLDSTLPDEMTREEAVMGVLVRAPASQRALFNSPIQIKCEYRDKHLWRQVMIDSAAPLRDFNKKLAMHRRLAGKAKLARLLTAGKAWLVRAFVRASYAVVNRISAAPLGRVLKAMLGTRGRSFVRRLMAFSLLRAESFSLLRAEIVLEGVKSGTTEQAPKQDAPIDPTDQLSAADWVALLAEGQHDRILKYFDPLLDGYSVMSSFTVPGAAAARLRAVIFAEGLLGDIGDGSTMARILSTRGRLLEEAIALAPKWAALSDWVAMNHFLAGNVEAAMGAFAAAESKRRDMALAAALSPDKARYLPRSCAFSIGLMSHLDGYVKHKILSRDGAPYRLLISQPSIVNPIYLDYWGAYVDVVTEPQQVQAYEQEEPALSPNWNWILPSANGGVEHIHKRIASIQRQWANERRSPLLVLSVEHREALAQQRRKWGMADDDWFVCLHVRSAGFYREAEGGANDFRNTRIEDYYPIIDDVVAQNGWVIRMGDSSMPPLPRERFAQGRVIDYALSAEKSELLDVALCASCRIFIAAPSGLASVAASFGRPCALLNYPVQAGLPWFPTDKFIFKRVYSRVHRRYLTLQEIFSSNIPYAITQYLLNAAQVELHGNDPVDMVELVREVLTGEQKTHNDHGQARKVMASFAALNERYGVGISGSLGCHFAARYAAELLGN